MFLPVQENGIGLFCIALGELFLFCSRNALMVACLLSCWLSGVSVLACQTIPTRALWISQWVPLTFLSWYAFVLYCITDFSVDCDVCIGMLTKWWMKKREREREKDITCILLSVCLCLSVCLACCLISVSVCLSVYLLIYMSVYLSINPSVYLSFICLSVCLERERERERDCGCVNSP